MIGYFHTAYTCQTMHLLDNIYISEFRVNFIIEAFYLTFGMTTGDCRMLN